MPLISNVRPRDGTGDPRLLCGGIGLGCLPNALHPLGEAGDARLCVAYPARFDRSGTCPIEFCPGRAPCNMVLAALRPVCRRVRRLSRADSLGGRRNFEVEEN